jgi:hypothetical protein
MLGRTYSAMTQLTGGAQHLVAGRHIHLLCGRRQARLGCWKPTQPFGSILCSQPLKGLELKQMDKNTVADR